MKLSSIKDFSDYMISPLGYVYSCKGGRRELLQFGTIKTGHRFVYLFKDGKGHKRYIHRLVLETFMGACPKGMEAMHLDGNPSNNKVDNLQWGTRSQNLRMSNLVGKYSKVSAYDISMIRYYYKTKTLNQYELAKMFKISQPAVNDIVNMKTYKDTKDVVFYS